MSVQPSGRGDVTTSLGDEHQQSSVPGVLDYARMTRMGTNWPIKWLIVSLVILVFLHLLLMPCLCAQGNVKLGTALGLDLMLGLRIVWANIRAERSRMWILYLTIVTASMVWIPLAVEGTLW